MNDLVEVSLSSVELADLSCPVCQDKFDIGHQVVRCPVCGSWHHLECWHFNNNHCSVLNCNGSGRLQSQPVSPATGEADSSLDDIAVQQNPIFIDILHIPDPDLIDEIVIQDDWGSNTYITSDDNTDTYGQELDPFSIETWELGLDKVVEKSRFNGFLEKTGIQKAIRRYVKGKDYYVALGVVIVWAVVLLTISVISILVLALNFFG